MRKTVPLLIILVLFFPLACKKKKILSKSKGSVRHSTSEPKEKNPEKQRSIIPEFVDIKKDTSRRNALVIGNGNYKSARLLNPVNDARDMAKALRKVGFTVMEYTNANRAEMGRAIQKFGNRLKKGGVGLFYYAGHGVQVKGINYLIPLGTNIRAKDDVQYEALNAGRVLSKMETAGNRMNIFILDACRDNPFGRSFRSAETGLAKMDTPSGTILVYSTAAGKKAADGKGRNSPFAKALLKYIKVANLEVLRMLNRVAVSVKKETGIQEPWIAHSPLERDFYFRRSKTAPSAPKGVLQNDLNHREKKLSKKSESQSKELALTKDKLSKAKLQVFGNDVKELEFQNALKMERKKIFHLTKTLQQREREMGEQRVQFLKKLATNSRELAKFKREVGDQVYDLLRLIQKQRNENKKLKERVSRGDPAKAQTIKKLKNNLKAKEVDIKVKEIQLASARKKMEEQNKLIKQYKTLLEHLRKAMNPK